MKKDRMVTHRIIAMLLSWMLLVGTVPGNVLAAEMQKEMGQSVDLPIEETVEIPPEDVSTEPAIEQQSGDVLGQEEEVTKSYTITLDANGGYFANEWDDLMNEALETTDILTKVIPVGGAVTTFPVYEQENAVVTFQGWSLERDGELVSQEYEEYIPLDNCVLYAAWKNVEMPEEGETEEVGEEIEAQDQEQVDGIPTESPEEDQQNPVASDEGDKTDTYFEYEGGTQDSENTANDEQGTQNKDVASDGGQESLNSEAASGSNEVIEGTIPGGQAQVDRSLGIVEETLGNSSNIVANGTCGDNLTWTLDEEGTLIISGTGEMDDYCTQDFNSYKGFSAGVLPPWFELRDSIERIVIQEGVTSIGKGAFTQAGVNDMVEFIAIPESLTTIKDRAFANTGCPSISFDHPIDFDDNFAFALAQFDEVIWENDELKSNLFSNSKIKKFTITGNVSTIPNACFNDIDTLTSITIPDTVTSIGNSAFCNCDGLKSVNIPDNVTNIGKRAFNGCSSLNSVNIEGGVETIGEEAFKDCPSLEKVTIGHGLKTIEPLAFSSCSSLKSLSLPEGLNEIGHHAFSLCSSLDVLSIPEGVTTIDESAFWGCGLNSVTLPSSLINIESRAFGECEDLKLINIPQNVKRIETETNARDSYASFFKSDNLLEIRVDSENSTYKSFDGCLYSSDLEELLYCPRGKESVTISPSTTTISDEVIAGNASNGDVSKIKEIYFGTYSPILSDHVFSCLTATVYYNNFLNNWPSDKRQNYGGTITWVEKPLNTEDCTMELSPSTYSYDGTAKKPTVTIKYSRKTLTENTDYTVSYSNNINAGTGTVTVTGKGYFSGTLSKSFMINKATPSLSFASTSVSKKTTDSAFTNVLTKKTDGIVTFASSNTSVAMVNSSTGLVTIKGEGSATITANAEAGTNYNAGSVSYELRVTKSTRNYSVSYDTNGGIGTPSTQKKQENETLTLSTKIPTKQHVIFFDSNGGSVLSPTQNVICTFTNWNTQKNGSGTAYTAGGSYIENEDVTLYAQWSDPEAGDLPTPTRSGYEFSGWFTSATGGYQIGKSSVITGNITLYAHWAESTLYAITDTITVGDTKATVGKDESYYSFTPEEYGYYCFSLKGKHEIYSRLEDSEGNTIAYGKDNTDYSSYEQVTYINLIYCALDKGKQYYLALRGDSYYDSSVITISVSKPDQPSSSGKCGDNVDWNLGNDGTLVISGEGNMYDYISEDAPWTPYSNVIKKVIVEEGVQALGAFSFYELNNLKELSLPDSITEFRTGSISYCKKISEITIPKSVKKIYCKAILACPSLNSIRFEAVRSEFVPNYEWTSDLEKQFAICDSDSHYQYLPCSTLEELTIGKYVEYVPAHIIDASSLVNVKKINYYAVDCKFESYSGWDDITEFNLGNEVQSIPPWVLSYNKHIKRIVLPDSVIKIGYNAFVNSALEYIYIPESVQEIDSGALKAPNLKTAGPVGKNYNIVYGWKSSIPKNAFNGSDINKCVFPSGLKTIGEAAFEDCEKLAELEFPYGLERIEDYAFCNGVNTLSLKSVEIPETVSYIGRKALPGMDKWGGTKQFAWYFRGKCPEFADYWGIHEYAGTQYYPIGDSSWDNLESDNTGGTVKRWQPNASVSIDGTYSTTVNEAVALSGVWESSNRPVNIEWTSEGNSNISFSETSILGPFNEGEKTEWYISTMVTSNETGYYPISLEVDGRKAHSTLYVNEKADDKGKLSVTEGPITLEKGKKYVIKAAYYDESGALAEAPGGITWSTVSDKSNSGDVNIKIVSDYYEYCLCEVTGTKIGTCGVVASAKGLKAPVTFYITEPSSSQKDIVQDAQPTNHLSGSKDYDLSQTSEGNIELRAPITSTVRIGTGSSYNAKDEIIIKKNGELKVDGVLHASKITVKDGGKLTISQAGKVSAYEIVAEGGNWFFQNSGGRVSLENGAVLKAHILSFNGYGRLSMESNSQIVSYQSFTYSSNVTDGLQGTLYIGGSMDVGKGFIVYQSNFATVFYGNTETSNFSFHKKSRVGTVYAISVDSYSKIGLSTDNIMMALRLYSVNRSEKGAWSYTPTTEKLEGKWEQEVGAWYRNLAARRQTVLKLEYYPGFSKTDLDFINRLADVWVTTVSGQVLNAGLTEISSSSYELVFKLHRKDYKIRYCPFAAGAYGNYGAVYFGEKNTDDDKLWPIGITASASEQNFWSQATAYLAESYVREYYQFVMGSIPNGKSDASIERLLKRKGQELAKKYIDKVVYEYLFSTLHETSNSAEVKEIEKTFKVEKLLLYGDMEGLWKFAAKEVKNRTASKKRAIVQLSQTAGEETGQSANTAGDQTETVVNGNASKEVTDEFLKEALIEVLGQNADGQPDFSNQEEVSFLDLSGRYIQSLDGIQNLTCLKTLILENNEIADLAPLREMASLQYLDVSGQDIKDIDPLDGLVNLLYLDLNNNDIDSISCIEGMTKLKELDISNTMVPSLEPLETVENLQILRAESIPFGEENLQALANIRNLKELHMEGCGLHSLEGINTETLTELYVKNNLIESMDPLSDAATLKTADLSGNMIETIPSLSGCTALESLDVSDNCLINLDGLADAPAVTNLNLSGCWLVSEDIEPVAQIPSIRGINLSDNGLDDISALLKNQNLETIDLTGAEVDFGKLIDIPKKLTIIDKSAVATGECGDDARWILSEKGQLTVYGKGAVANYDDTTAPWKGKYIADIKIGDGITDIGNQAFNGLNDLETLYVPKTVETIGSAAFSDCGKLNEILFPSAEIKIGKESFLNASEELTIYGLPDSTAEVYAKDNSITFKYLGIDIKSLKDAVINVKDQTFTGKPLRPKVSVKLDENTLKEGSHYKVSYKNNTNAGIATVTVTGIGIYNGISETTFAINKAEQSITAKSTAGSIEVGKTATVSISGAKGKKSFKSSDTGIATVNASTGVVTAKKVGTVKITATSAATSNYKAASNTITIKVVKGAQSITAKTSASSIAVGKTATVSITGNKGTKSYKSSNTAVAAVTSAGKVTAKKVGIVKITATSAATSNYNAASKTVTIKVVPAATASIAAANQATGIKLTWKRVTGATGYKVYRGSTLIKTIKSGSTVTCTDTKANTNGGKYTFKIIPTASTGNGPAKSLATYRVARPAVSSVSNSASKRMTVKWGKNAKANGYQLQYSTSKNFASGNKAVTVTSASTVSKVIGSLTKGKTYYVRIRTYKTVGKAKYWSTWSPAKSVRIKK